MKAPFQIAPAEATLRALYQQRCWVILPAFLPPIVAAAWEEQSRDLPVRAVHVDGPGGELWWEQGGPALQANLGEPFADQGLRQQLGRIIGLQLHGSAHDQVWLNRYRTGNPVPTHRDVDGDAQLLVCLQGLAKPERGGDLVLEGQRLPLATGDALLFAARQLRHGTSRIDGCVHPASGCSRVVLVLRLFAS